MRWPLSQDYNEAIQSPESSFADPELRGGEVATNALGLPMPCSGNFADVYRFLCPHTQRTWAVKCFTRQIPGLHERYQQISSHLQKGKPTFMVDFTFLDRGIQVRGDWFPIVKMQWVEGFTLNQFIKSHLDKPQVLDVLCQLWVKLATRLREANIAHCDLQHGNVLLVPGSKAGAVQVRLVDYDGMCVPALTLLKSIELGHPSYQHPQRLREGIYSLEVDRFSHQVIYTALRSLMVVGPALWERYDNGDNLLFCQEDFQAPAKSRLFYDLLKLEDASVRSLAEQLIETVRKPLDHAPLLEQLVAKPAAPHSSAPAAMMGMNKGVGQNTPGPSPFDLHTMTAPGGGIALAKRKTGLKRAPSSTRKWPVAMGVCVVGLLLVGLLAAGVFRVQTKDGVLVVQVNEPNADVYVDGAQVTVTWGAGGKKAEISVKPGTRQVSVKKDGFTAYGREVTLEDGGRQNLTARLEKTKVPGGLAKARTPEPVEEEKSPPVQPPAVPDPVAKPQPPTDPGKEPKVFNHSLATADALEEFYQAGGQYGSRAVLEPGIGLTLGGGHSSPMIWFKPFLGDQYRVQFEVQIRNDQWAGCTLNGPGYGNSPDSGYWCRFNKKALWFQREGVEQQMTTLPTPIAPGAWVNVQVDFSGGKIAVVLNDSLVVQFADSAPLTGPLHGWFGMGARNAVFRNLRIWSSVLDTNRVRQLTPPVAEKPCANGQLLYELKLSGKDLGSEWWKSQPASTHVKRGGLILSGPNGCPEVILTKPMTADLACEVEFEYASFLYEAVNFSILLWNTKKAPQSSKECDGGWVVHLPDANGRTSIRWHRGPKDAGGPFGSFATQAPILKSTPYYAATYQRKYLARIEAHGDDIRVFLDGGLLLAARRPAGAGSEAMPMFLGLHQVFGGSTIHALRVYQIAR